MKKNVNQNQWKNKKMVVLFGSVALVIVLMSVLFVMQTSSQYQLHGNAFQVFAGSRIEYPTKTKFVYKELGPALKNAKDGEYVASSPVYYQEESLAMLPNDMVYVNPRTLEFAKLEAFSELTLENGRVMYDGEELTGFLFDGSGTYVFLEPMTLKIDLQEYHLAPLSMVMVSSNQVYCLFSYADKQMYYNQNASDTLFAYGEGFKVELQGDVFYGSNGERTLLFNDAKLLDPLP